MKVEYWLARYVPDLLRNEPRNVGVLVRRGKEVAARFVGEDDDLELDQRKLGRFPFPEVYTEWVRFWRRKLPSGDLSQAGGYHYRLEFGGYVTDTEPDSVQVVADFLFARLVGDNFADLEGACDGTDVQARAGSR